MWECAAWATKMHFVYASRANGGAPNFARAISKDSTLAGVGCTCICFRRTCGAGCSGEARQPVRIRPGAFRHEQHKADHGIQAIFRSIRVTEGILEM